MFIRRSIRYIQPIAARPLVASHIGKPLLANMRQPVQHFATSSAATDTLMGGLKFLYAENIKSQTKRRELGVVPADILSNAKALLKYRHPTNVLPLLKRMLIVDPLPGELDIYKQAGDILFANKYYAEASQFWRKGTHTQAELNSLHHTAGEQLLAQGNWEMALSFWKPIPDKKITDYYKQIGEHLFAKGDFAKAIKFFEDASVDNLVQRYEEAGDKLYLSGKCNEAMVFFQKAIDKGTTKINTYINMGNSQLRQGKIDPAARNYERAYKLCSEDRAKAYALNQCSVALFMAAITWAPEDKFHEIKKIALQNLNMALQLDPENSVISQNLDVVKVLDNEPRFGKPYSFLEHQPGQPTALFSAILRELKANRMEEKTSVSHGETDSTFAWTWHDGIHPTYVPSVHSKSETTYVTPVYANDLAIHELNKLKVKWDEIELQRKTRPAPRI